MKFQMVEAQIENIGQRATIGQSESKQTHGLSLLTPAARACMCTSSVLWGAIKRRKMQGMSPVCEVVTRRGLQMRMRPTRFLCRSALTFLMSLFSVPIAADSKSRFDSLPKVQFPSFSRGLKGTSRFMLGPWKDGNKKRWTVPSQCPEP